MNRILLVSFFILSSTHALHPMEAPSTSQYLSEKPFILAITEEVYKNRALKFIRTAQKLRSTPEFIEAFLCKNQTPMTEKLSKLFDTMSDEHMAIHVCHLTLCFSEHTHLIVTTPFVKQQLSDSIHHVEPAHFRIHYLKIPKDVLNIIKNGDEELFKDAISCALEEQLQPQHGLHVSGIQKTLHFPKDDFPQMTDVD